MIYTTHGAMTAADLDEIRRDYDLDLCPCCESGQGAAMDPAGPRESCEMCGHGPDEHV